MSKLYAGLAALKDGSMDFGEVMLYYSDVPLPVFIYETVLKKKEGKDMARIINQPFIDLRNFTPEALRKIKSIVNVALILLPENPSAEFAEAYAAIKKMNIAEETQVPGKACVFNGLVTLTKEDVAQDSIIVCNGLTVVRDIPKEMNVRLIVNGTFFKSSTAFAEPIKINGATYKFDDDAKLIKSVKELNIDRNFINNLTEKTAIIACGKVFIDDEITNDMLNSKGITFYAVAQIAAKKELHGYIQANSNDVALILTKEEAEKRAKKGRRRKLGWK